MSSWEETPQEEEDNVVKLMLIVCGVAGGVFTLLYLCYFRERKSDDSGNSQDESSAESLSVSETESQKEDTNDAATFGNGRIRATHKWEHKERQPGDPVYDKLFIGGTISLAVLLLIGAAAVLTICLIDQSKYRGASAQDFQSLGPEGCLIESSFSYSYSTVELTALNSVCQELWEYNVEIVAPDIEFFEDNVQETSFVSAPLVSAACHGTCEVCQSRGKLAGPDYFVGLNPTRPGINIPANGTFAECFVPTIPVESLSDFYNCGPQRSENGTCYLLEDTATALIKEQDSVRIGLSAAYACFAGAIVIFGVVGYFMHQNKKVREMELSQLQEVKTDPEANQSDAPGLEANKDSELDKDRRATLESEKRSLESGGKELAHQETGTSSVTASSEKPPLVDGKT